jgi:hypothetical protein
MRLSTAFLLVVTIAMFTAFGIFYQSPSTIERALAFGGGITGLISFAYTVYRGLIDLFSNHATRWANQAIVKPIATLVVMMNEDLKKKPIQEIITDLQKSKEITNLILESIKST